MKHWKKFFAAALACVMVLAVLTGCGQSMKDYQMELNGKLESANIGVHMDAQMNRSAEAFAEIVGGSATGAMSDAERRELLGKVHWTGKTKYCMSITDGKQVISCDFDLVDSTSKAAPVDFFVQTLKEYNEKHPNAKFTRVGIGKYHIVTSEGSADFYILLAE